MDFQELLYGGRSWLKSRNTELPSDIKTTGRLKIVSYNVLADCKISNVRYSTTKSWESRCNTLIREIQSYEADVVCLQDADKFVEFWRPKLMKLGYDSVFKQRTKFVEYHAEGVVIAYKRDLFQLFKMTAVEFNDAAMMAVESTSVFREKCRSDDVGLILFLQPWPIVHRFTSAFCICSASLCERESYSDVRLHQSIYFTKQIEKANSEFQVPIFMGIGLNDLPSSPAYHVLRTGRTPLAEEVPKQCPIPTCIALSRSSAKVKWLPPPKTGADSKIIKYTIAWRPGGSRTLGFRATKEIPADDCVQFTTLVDLKGDKYTVTMDELAYNVTGLVSELPYEFKIKATNIIGDGLWSEASLPLILPNPPGAPPMPDLVFLRDIVQVNEIREQTSMERNDWDVEIAVQSNPIASQTQLTPRDINGRRMPDVPRGRVLPISSNPREGWSADLKGVITPSISSEVNRIEFLKKFPLIRNHDGTFINTVSDTSTGKLALYDEIEVKSLIGLSDSNIVENTMSNPQESVILPSLVSDTFGSFSQSLSVENSLLLNADLIPINNIEQEVVEDNDNIHIESSSEIIVDEPKLIEIISSIEADYNFDKIEEMEDLRMHEDDSNEFKTKLMIPTFESTKVAKLLDDDTILDAKDALKGIGKPSRRHVHSCFLASAYESYSSGGEPYFTTSTPLDAGGKGVCCTDFIFYSSNCCITSRILSLPHLSMLNGETPNHTVSCSNRYWNNPIPPMRSLFVTQSTIQHAFPSSHDSKNLKELIGKSVMMPYNISPGTTPNDTTCQFWGGVWIPFVQSNQSRVTSWLPNDIFCSSHVALGAEFEVLDQYLSSQWK